MEILNWLDASSQDRRKLNPLSTSNHASGMLCRRKGLVSFFCARVSELVLYGHESNIFSDQKKLENDHFNVWPMSAKMNPGTVQRGITYVFK